MGSERQRTILCNCIFIALYAAGLLAGGCDAKPDPGAEESISITVPFESTETTVHTTSAATSPVAMAAPSPASKPVIRFQEGDEESILGTAATLEYTMDGIYYVGSGNVLSLPDSASEDLDLYLDSEIISQEIFSNDGSCVAVIPVKNFEGLGTLFYCDGKYSSTVSENVDSFAMSDDGSTILYLAGFYEHGVGGSLYLYDRESRTSTLLAEGAGRLFTISPSGTAFAYTAFSEKYDPDSLLCYTCLQGEKPKLLDERVFPLTLTDKADVVYAQGVARDGGYLSIYENGEKIELFGKDGEECVATRMVFNIDRTQLVFARKPNTYFYTPGYPATEAFEEIFTSIARGSYIYSVSDGARNEFDVELTGTTSLCHVEFLIDLKKEYSDEPQVATMAVFDENLQCTKEVLNPEKYSIQTIDPIEADSWNGEPIRFVREDSPDYLYYFEVDESLPYYPEYSSDDNIPYGSFYQTLYRVEDEDGAEPKKIADLVCEVVIGEYGIYYKQYSRPYNKSDGMDYKYLDIVDVYYSPDGETFTYAFDQERRITIAFGG